MKQQKSQNAIIQALILFILLFQQNVGAKSGITFRHNGGRVGDVLLDLAKNYEIALKYGLNLYLDDNLPYVQNFMLDLEIPRISAHAHEFNQARTIRSDHQIDPSADNILYRSEFYIAINGVSDLELFHGHVFQCSIEQPVFGTNIKRLLTPKADFSFEFPENRISVAMHIRKGGGFDHPLASELYRPAVRNDNATRTSKYQFVDRDQPFKFPPEQYYVDQLIFLHALLDQQPLYVFLFTDDKEPQTIVERIQEKLLEHNITNITFDYRKTENAHNLNIIEDISFMSKFEYLIKSGSHYPWIAQMIGNHKAIISPIEYRWDGDYLNIIHAEITFPDREKHVLKKFKIPSISNVEHEPHSDN